MEDIISSAKIERRRTALQIIPTIIIWLLEIFLVSTTYNEFDTGNYTYGFHHYKSVLGTIYYDNGYDADYCAIVLLILIPIFLLPLIINVMGKFIAKRCQLNLTENQVYGELKTLFGSKKLQIPIEKLDTIMTENSFLDKIRSGETLLVRSTSGVVKFHYVQNAEKFSRAALEQIEKFKSKSKSENPAPAVNETGGSAAEKINSLKQMLDSGLISQEEFEFKKKDILSKM